MRAAVSAKENQPAVLSIELPRPGVPAPARKPDHTVVRIVTSVAPERSWLPTASADSPQLAFRCWMVFDV
jgi:hypothetical protein